MGIEAVTLDAFGTVLDTGRAALIEVAAHVVSQERIGSSPASFLAAWDGTFFALQAHRNGPFRNLVETSERSLQETLRRFGSTATAGPYIDGLLARWRKARPFPDAVAALERLRGIPTAIVSNADDAFLRDLLGRCGVEVEIVITSEAAKSYKPDAGIFLAALSALGTRPESTVHVGDSYDEDVVGSKRVGMRAAWLNRAASPRPSTGPPADYETSDLMALLRLLGRAVE